MSRYFTALVLGALLVISGSSSAQSANSGTEPLWVQYMLEPNPNYYKVKKAFDEYWKDSVPKRGGGYKVFKRWEYRVTQRMLSDGTILWPSGALQSLLADSVPALNPARATSGASGGGGGTDYNLTGCPANGRWTPVGPIRHPWNQTGQPTGIGRVAGIAFDPKDSNTFFACAPQGGIWKTTDTGATWNFLFGTNPVVNTIGVTSMVVSYNSSDTIYIGTGDKDAGDAPGFGVLASFDGGKTWVARNSGISSYTVGRMVMDPANSKILMIATNNGIYRTTNGGSSWSQVIAGNAWDICFHPLNRNIVYASVNNSTCYVYRSTDNGVSWTKITSGLPSNAWRGMLAVTKNGRGTVYFLSTASTTFLGLYRSTDSANNFSAMSTSPNILGYSETGSDASGQGWYDLDLAADPKNKDIVYVGGVNIWKSTNGGANWSISGHWVGNGGADDIHADQHALEFNTTGNKLYAGNDGGIYFSINSGTNWNNMSSGIMNSQIYRIAHAKTDPFVSAQGYQDNGSAQTQEDQFYSYYGGDGMDCQVDPTDASYVYGAYVYGSIYRAIGKTSIISLAANGTNGVNEGGAWLTPFVLQEGNPSRMFAGYNNIWRCDNVKSTGSISWTKISNSLGGSNSYNISFLENSPAKNSILYALRNDGKLFRTSNATAASPVWTDLSTNLPGSSRWLEAHPKDSNIIYLCAGTNIYKSYNRGASWTSITSGLSGVGQIQCMILDTSGKKDAMYIGTEKGVYFRDTAMSSWINYSTGFPIWADVSDIDIYYSPKGSGYSKLVASTYGRGVWRTNLYEDGTATPVSGFYAFDSTFVTGGKMRLYEQVKNSVSSLTWKITPYTYSYAEGTDSTSNNPVIVFNASGAYTVALTATNCNGNYTYTKAAWVKVFNKSSNPNCYSTTYYWTNNYGFGIMKFLLSDNMSETGGYFDDGPIIDISSNKIYRLKPSTTYTATIKTGLYYNEYVRVFIDYNNNGKFENYLGEAVISTSSSYGTRTANFTTPASLKMNTGMRLRVLGDYNSLDTNACNLLSYGQAEDYTCVYEKTIPYFKANKTSACTYENLTFTDTSFGLVGKWEWDFGSGAVPSTATGKGPYTVYYTSTGTKNVRLRINGIDSVRKNSYLTISTGPVPQIIVKTGNAAGCEGRSITLAARVLNGVPFTVQWQKNGSNISGKTDTLLVLSNVTMADSGTYTAVFTNGSCVSTAPALKIQVYAKPTASFTENSSAQCKRYNFFSCTTTSTIAQGSISSYLWRLGDGSTAATTVATKSYANTGNYTVKLIVTSNKGCMDSTTHTETVYPNATVKFTVNDSDQCLSGNSFVFTNGSSIATGSITYGWQFGDGNTSSSTSPTQSYSSSGIYTVRLISTSNNGCKDTATKPVRIYSQPAVSWSANAANQCFRGNKFTFTNGTTNTDGSVSYTWRFGNGATSTNNSPVYSYPAVGGYAVKLIALTSFGCKDSSSSAVNVYPNANLKFTVNDTDQCLSNNSLTFTNGSSISSGTLGYTWDFGDATNSSATSPVKSYSASGSYTVKLYSNSDKGCKDTLSKPVRIYSQPAVSFSKNTNSRCLKLADFSFSNATTNTDGSLTYLWRFGDGSTSTNTSPTKKYSTDGVFSVKLIATSFYGCKDSNSQTVTVFPQAVLKFTVNDSDQCVKGNVFNFTNNSATTSGTLSYLWAFGDNQTASTANASHTYLSFGQYVVKLTTNSNNGCKDTLQKNVRVYAQPNPDFSINNTPQCLKGNAFAFANSSNTPEGTLTYLWKFGNGAQSTSINPSYSYPAGGNWQVTLRATTSFGCTDSIVKSVTVFPKAKMAFSFNDSDQCFKGNAFVMTSGSSVSSGSINSQNWNFGDGNAAAGNTANHSYAPAGLYQVQLVVLSNGICRDSLSKPLRVYAQPVAGISTTTAIAQCQKYNRFGFVSGATSADGSLTVLWNFGDSVKTTGNSVSHSYKWPAVIAVGQKVTSSFGCTDSTSKNIEVYHMPHPDFTTSKAVHCEKSAVPFSNQTRIGNGSFKSEWHFTNAASDTSTQTNPQHAFASFGNYPVLLIASSDHNCRDSALKTVKVASVPAEVISANPKHGCAGQTIFEYTDSSTNADGSTLTHLWTYNDGSGKTDTARKVTHIWPVAGNYTVTLVSTSPWCSNSTTYSQLVEPAVHASFVMDTINKETRRYTATDTIIKGYSYQWLFSDGATVSGNPVVHKFLRNDQFTVKLKVLSAYGCRDSSDMNTTIKSPNYRSIDNSLNFYVYPNPTPQAFTYKFEVKEKRSVTVKLYDVKGQLELYSKTWDNVEPGTYYEEVNLRHLGLAAATYPLVVISGKDKVEVKIVYTGGQ